jgi:hypothetical protein
MKRFTLIVALVLMIAMPTFAERVTSETARKVASTFLNNNGAKSTQLTDLSKEAGFPNLFIFNGEDGFVVMAADDCVQPILGYSLAGKFDAKDMPENLRWWLQGYSDEIQSAIDNKTRATSETAKMWKDLAEGNSKAGKATMTVAPLIQTKWNQNKYYNDLCPAVSDGPNGHAYTGCVATAMAQIMKYWSYPSTGIGSHSYTWNGQTLNADFGATTYDWNNMANYYEYYFENGTDEYPNPLPEPSAEEIAAVATLMYHCGVSVDMIYGGNSTGGSAAPNAYVSNALKTYFNYKNTAQYKQKTNNSNVYYTDDEWIAMLKADLDAGHPLQYGGQDPNGDSGHAFVCDGYNSDDYFHFNWGWAGIYNGYFTISNLDTGANSSQAGAGNGNYTRNQDAVFGIEPGSMVPAPTNLTYTLSGLNDITLTWDAVSAASSYNVYRNGNLVGNTTETTYSETAPFGELSYYVRCVDANSQLSLSSNSVTVTIAYQTPIVTDLTVTLSDNNANLTWTAPEWCYPETPSATLTYGDGNMYGINSTQYWAHRYLSDNLSQYANKVIYKISIYAYATGSYTCYIYKGATETSSNGDNIFWPSTLMTSKTIEVTSTSEWIDIDLDELVTIDGQDDIWVVMHDPNNGNGRYSATFTNNPGNNNHGGYWGGYHNFVDGNLIPGYVLNNGRAFLIKTYITDGTYTYNLYDGTSQVASNIDATNYTVSNVAGNTAHRYTLKTNYYGGETENSNLAGLTLGEASLASLAMTANDKMTITEGSKLIVTGTLSDENADNLILEDGAQLFNNSTEVLATVKKNINGYIGDGGWYLLASPIAESITPTVDNGLLANDYDLYTFDQSEELEWRNIEASAFNTIDNKIGYLYANNGNPTLSFTGTLVANTTATTLTYNSNADFKGFNLIGNPYPCNTYVDRSFYVLNEDGSDFTLGSNPIPPCSAILVQAQGTGESVTFNKNASKSGPNIAIAVTKANTRSNAIIDQARVSFNEKDQLIKYSLSGQNGKLYIPQNGQDFAVAYANEESEMPINFKAAKNDTYTISIETEGLELGYLHLIDNLTGDDVDLLATPSYTFEAKTSDYATRFKLVFGPICEDADGDNATFAYISDGNIIVNNVGESLQIVDMMGRVIAEGDEMNRISTREMTPGVYVLRLINGEMVRTQKIVIE